MKKSIANLLKNTQLLTVLSIIISIFLLILLGPSLLFPKFSAWRDKTAKNDQEGSRLTAITENVTLLQQIDTQNLQLYSDLVRKLLPAQADELRVVALIDELVKRSGVSLESVKVISKTASSTTAATTAQVAPTAGSPEAAPKTTSGTTAAPTQAATASAFNVSVTFKGTFAESLQLIDLLSSTKRTMSIEKISFTREQNSNDLGVNVEFSLPLGKEAAVSPETKVEFSAADTQALKELLAKLTIDVSPTALPTGRSNPFN
ncbi:MAG: hypothetical protein Q8O75_02690 [bacterium]|nr:hypothetical protein [bacterium]